jgi:hypothetical protein
MWTTLRRCQLDLIIPTSVKPTKVTLLKAGDILKIIVATEALGMVSCP